MFISTAVLCVFGNIASALVGFGYRSHASSFSVFYQLAIVRFLLGKSCFVLITTHRVTRDVVLS